jgi:hypothetical protein
VGFHVFGAVCVFVCVQQLLLELTVADHRPAVDTAAPSDATTTRGIAVAR